MQPRAFIVVILAGFGLSCADGTVPARGAEDPSSPTAPEVPFAGGTPVVLPTAPKSPTGPVVYSCPMHHEVERDAPGACPICGMTLVPHPKAGP